MKDKFQTHSWIVKTTGKRLWLIVLLCFIHGVLAINGVIYALLMRNTVDAAVAGIADEFWIALASFAGVILLQVVLRSASRYTSERTRISVENRLREWAFAAILGQDARTASSRHSGDLMTRLTSDVTVVTTGVVSFVPSVVSMSVRVVGVFAAMMALVPSLAMVFLALGALLGLASISLRGLMKRLHKRQQEAEGHMRSFLQECLESQLVIRAFNVSTKVQNLNQNKTDEYKQARMKRANVSNAGSTGLSLVIQGGYVLGFAWCGIGILQGTISYGTLMAVIQLINQIQSPFAQMGGVFSQYSVMLASAERLMELTENAKKSNPAESAPAAPLPDAPSAGEAAPLGVHQIYDRLNSICFEGVSFAYDRERVLDSFSLEIPKGSFVAIAGSSGIGKSTLMKLLMGAYEPAAGRIFLKLEDGSEVESPSMPTGMFAYVPQGNHLMSGTIREVVGFAERGDCINEARLVQACRTACALDFVSDLPEGFDTVLGERGAGLSEGQIQRLAMARALYSTAPILLLDEATSALDEQTEHDMLESLKQLDNRTVIVITHRPEALRISDMLIDMGEARHDKAQ